MKKLPIKYVPGHELIGLPRKATSTVDQGQGSEATDQEGAELHSSGVDVIELWTQRERGQKRASGSWAGKRVRCGHQGHGQGKGLDTEDQAMDREEGQR